MGHNRMGGYIINRFIAKGLYFWPICKIHPSKINKSKNNSPSTAYILLLKLGLTYTFPDSHAI